MSKMPAPDRPILEALGLRLFDSFPYLTTRIVAALYHIILVPSDLPVESLEKIAFRQATANRLKTCLVLGEKSCVHFAPDGSSTPNDSPPECSSFIAGKLLSPSDFPEDEDLRARAKRLDAFVDAGRREGFLFGDMRKGGRPATEEELKRLSGTRHYEIPRGLVYCEKCGQPLYEYKLNANYYETEDGQIWHVPGFCGFRHVCPDR